MAKPGGAMGKAQGMQLLALAGVLVVLIGVGYYLLFYRALSEDIDNAEAQRSTLVTQETTWMTKQRSYRSDVEELNLRRTRSREQVKILPTEADMDAFMDNLNSIADLSGLSIVSTQPELEQPQEGFYARLPVRLEVMGLTGEEVDLTSAKPTSNYYWIVDDSRTQIWQLDSKTVYVPFDILQKDLGMQRRELENPDTHEKIVEPARTSCPSSVSWR